MIQTDRKGNFLNNGLTYRGRKAILVKDKMMKMDRLTFISDNNFYGLKSNIKIENVSDAQIKREKRL